jgi:hypothetical protein
MTAQNTPTGRPRKGAFSSSRLIASIPLLLASVWPSASRAEAPVITWTQTAQFDLANTAATIGRSEGFSPNPPMQAVEQDGTLEFAGALAGFQVGNLNYVLTGVQANLSSTYSSNVQFAGYDCCVLSDVYMAGQFQATIQTRFSFDATVKSELVQSWSDWKMDDCWAGRCDMLVNHPVATPIERQWRWTDTSLFVQAPDLKLELSKHAIMEMTAWRNDDSWDELRNPLNQWKGSVTLQYSYQAQPVPEASGGSMLVAGGLAVAMVCGRRRRKAFSAPATSTQA